MQLISRIFNPIPAREQLVYRLQQPFLESDSDLSAHSAVICVLFYFNKNDSTKQNRSMPMMSDIVYKNIYLAAIEATIKTEKGEKRKKNEKEGKKKKED